MSAFISTWAGRLCTLYCVSRTFKGTTFASHAVGICWTWTCSHLCTFPLAGASRALLSVFFAEQRQRRAGAVPADGDARSDRLGHRHGAADGMRNAAHERLLRLLKHLAQSNSSTRQGVLVRAAGWQLTPAGQDSRLVTDASNVTGAGASFAVTSCKVQDLHPLKIGCSKHSTRCFPRLQIN